MASAELNQAEHARRHDWKAYISAQQEPDSRARTPRAVPAAAVVDVVSIKMLVLCDCTGYTYVDCVLPLLLAVISTAVLPLLLVVIARKMPAVGCFTMGFALSVAILVGCRTEMFPDAHASGWCVLAVSAHRYQPHGHIDTVPSVRHFSTAVTHPWVCHFGGAALGRGVRLRLLLARPRPPECGQWAARLRYLLSHMALFCGRSRGRLVWHRLIHRLACQLV